MSKIVVTVKALIPVIQYGNIAIEATQEIDISEGDDIQIWTVDTVNQVRKALADSILPLVEAEVERCASVLLKEANPDNWMRRNSTVYQWFKISNPDVVIPAMQAIMASKEIPNRDNSAASRLSEFGTDNEAKRKMYEQLHPFGDDTSMR